MRYTLEKECLGNPDHQAIFMVPGWAMPKECLQELALALSKKFYVVLVNLPGVSLKPQILESRIGPNYDVDALSEQLIASSPKDAWWLGWSLGGMLASYVAARRSSCVKGLITVSTTPSFVQSADWEKAMSVKAFDQFATLIHDNPQVGMKRFIALQTKGLANNSAIQQQLNQWANDKVSTALARLGGLRLLRSLDVRREFEILDLPSLHLLGGKDELVNPSWLDDVSNDFYPLEKYVFEDGAHQPFMEDLPTFLFQVERFIDAH